jgi:hypothetical protein
MVGTFGMWQFFSKETSVFSSFILLEEDPNTMVNAKEQKIVSFYIWPVADQAWWWHPCEIKSS